MAKHAISIQELIQGLETAGKEIGFDAPVCVSVGDLNVIDVITDNTEWATIIVEEHRSHER